MFGEILSSVDSMKCYLLYNNNFKKLISFKNVLEAINKLKL